MSEQIAKLQEMRRIRRQKMSKKIAQNAIINQEKQKSNVPDVYLKKSQQIQEISNKLDEQQKQLSSPQRNITSIFHNEKNDAERRQDSLEDQNKRGNVITQIRDPEKPYSLFQNKKNQNQKNIDETTKMNASNQSNVRNSPVIPNYDHEITKVQSQQIIEQQFQSVNASLSIMKSHEMGVQSKKDIKTRKIVLKQLTQLKQCLRNLRSASIGLQHLKKEMKNKYKKERIVQAVKDMRLLNIMKQL